MFAESYFNKAGVRVFDIAVNGKVLESKVDILKHKGKNFPLWLQFVNIASVDGKLEISLRRVIQNPTLNGIYISGPRIGRTAIGGFEDGTC